MKAFFSTLNMSRYRIFARKVTQVKNLIIQEFKEKKSQYLQHILENRRFEYLSSFVHVF